VRGIISGLTAAFLFGISPPRAKLLLPGVEPLVMAGLLYLGAGLGLWTFESLRDRLRSVLPRESGLRHSDRWILAGIVLTGGILGPVLMLSGLSRLTAITGSLLLNFEAPLTMIMAILIFGEHLTRLETAAAALIVLGGIVLNYHGVEAYPDVVGVLAIIAATGCWALDNNLTQRLSIRDPIVVARIKTLTAGLCMVTIALLTGYSFPGGIPLAAILALGLVSYGVSVVLDVYGLRLLGAAREAAFFATAPFVGAALAVPVLGEHWSTVQWSAAVIMAGGVALLVHAHHSHLHIHDWVEHEHLHVHEDQHHSHHDRGVREEEPHSHLHHHLPLVHDHPHVSEIHHRHEHSGETESESHDEPKTRAAIGVSAG
jgi:drug/metabolite transporter (DMT)-like permease